VIADEHNYTYHDKQCPENSADHSTKGWKIVGPVAGKKVVVERDCLTHIDRVI